MTYKARRIANRTLSERIFSCRPWIKRKVIVVEIPRRMCYYLKAQNVIVCHPLRVEYFKGENNAINNRR
jgi:hypothetical protein